MAISVIVVMPDKISFALTCMAILPVQITGQDCIKPHNFAIGCLWVIKAEFAIEDAMERIKKRRRSQMTLMVAGAGSIIGGVLK